MKQQIELPCKVGDKGQFNIFGTQGTVTVDYICAMVSKRKIEYDIIGTTDKNKRFEFTGKDINKYVFFNS